MSTVATARGPSTILTTMHPDCLLLPQPHTASSPRLTAATPTTTPTTPTTIIAKTNTDDMLEDNKMDDSMLSIDDDNIQQQQQQQLHHDDDMDAVSICSDTSELSVGQEQSAAQQPQLLPQPTATTTPPTTTSTPTPTPLRYNHVSAFSSVQINADAMSDARSSISTDEPATTPHCLDDEMLTPEQQQQQPTTTTTPARHVVMDPFIVANALRIPVPLMPRVNASPFQEEFLRKSQIYAGELMKQQMQLMAAARCSVPLPLQNSHHPPTHLAQLSAISKITQLNAVAAAAAAAAAVVANNQKMSPTNNGGNTVGNSNSGSDALAQLSALSMAQQQSQALKTVSSLNRLQAQMQAVQYGQQQQQQQHNLYNNNNLHHHHHYNNHHHHNNNNNLQHETSLKFSIDNILKADFGRRIAAAAAAQADQTLLLKQRRLENATNKRNQNNNNNNNEHVNDFLTATTPTPTSISTPATNAAMDLSSLMSSAVAAASTNFSNTLANICTNSNDSNSTAVSSSTTTTNINNNNNNNNNNNSNNNNNNSEFSMKSPSPTTNSIRDVLKKSDVQTECGSVNSATTTTATTGSATTTTTTSGNSSSGTGASGNGPIVWPAWVYCTRYSDRPSSGPRTRKPKKAPNEKGNVSPSSGSSSAEDKRPRTAFSGSQLARLKHEFTENRYLTEKRRQQLSSELGLNEAQIKIWFQNKRAKLKKSSGTKNPLALQLMAQGLYNHSTVPLTREEEELQELQEREREAAVAAAAAT